jgi:His/Glu/Gln/Arg/opine family amino acid ABC transporter permease subunit
MLDTLRQKIYETFIFQDRYMFFVDGLKVTLLLTFASFILGTAVGILLCAGKRSSNPTINKISKLISTFFMEMPTMVLLMILVYIVFGSSALPILWIVILGLTIKTGTYLSEIFESSLATVAPGEIEAARTLGMSRWQAFRYVALPQTVTAALPLYRNQFIAAMQETSVVGYLAVVDLTRASSIVTSRTLDAFFGLVTITIIYFLIGLAAKAVFRWISKRTTRGGEAA